MKTWVWLSAVGLMLFVGAVAAATDPVAFITEIQAAGGHVQVRATGGDWAVPQPLLALRPGDQVRAVGPARAVLLFHAGGVLLPVTAANSPFTVAQPTDPSRVRDQFSILAGKVSEFLVGKQAAPAFKRLSVRSDTDPEGGWPAILHPRESRLLPGVLVFEWTGTDRVLYDVRVTGPRGIVWEEREVARQRLVYPEAAPPLEPGVRYAWELQAAGQPAQRARFEIVPPAEVARIKKSLAILEGAARDGKPSGTLTVMRVALLYEQGLYMEARRELEAAIAVDAANASLHFLLGHVYQQVGLSARAALAFEHVRALSGRP